MPTDENEILAAADKLGQLVAQHPSLAKFRNARKAVTEDPDASRLMGEVGRLLETLSRQEQSGMAVTDAQRQKLEALQTQIASHIKVKALSMAEYEFTDLLRRVSQAWQKHLAEATGAGAGGARASAAPTDPRNITGA
jgi:cell fate (sporulation/competence/biofilm development) regulator YlbF (YheA/YmcA/DUF963 family)